MENLYANFLSHPEGLFAGDLVISEAGPWEPCHVGRSAGSTDITDPCLGGGYSGYYLTGTGQPACRASRVDLPGWSRL